MQSAVSGIWLFLVLKRSFTCTSAANYTFHAFRDSLFLVIKRRDGRPSVGVIMVSTLRRVLIL